VVVLFHLHRVEDTEQNLSTITEHYFTFI
jgi:hypothetical protein